MKIVIFFIVAIPCTFAIESGYEGYKVYRVKPSTDRQVASLITLANNDKLDFWSNVRQDGSHADIMVAPEEQAWFVSFLEANSIKYETLIEDVHDALLKESLGEPKLKLGQIDFKRYLRHDEINAYLDQLAQDYPDLVTVVTAGKSYEGRDLNVLQISTNSSASKPVIFIDAGIHAREWIAPPVALYAINQLVENATNSNLLEKVDWHILPVVNADGYEYTHRSISQRFWRKTRKPGDYCVGTDGNRNYDYHWAEVGSSADECSEIYHGERAFSEPEVAAVRDHVLSNKDRIKLYLTLHSYGQLIVYPWSYTTELPENHEELQAVGELAAGAIGSVAGTTYTVAGSTGILGATAGSSDDWAKGGAGVELAYTVELPGGGSSGFNPPSRRILPVVVETWEGLKAFHGYIAKKFA